MINYNINNKDLFEKIQSFDLIYNIQNYIPIFHNLVDNLDENNINNINLETNKNVDILSISYSDITCNINNNLTNIHCKYAPIIDPIRYMIGKYDNHEFTLPSLDNNKDDKYNIKIQRDNNNAYIDGFFSYLSSKLLGNGFIHGINFYGMFICQHKEFKLNIVDDIEFLDKSTFFHKNLNNLFFIDESIFEDDSNESGKKNNKLKLEDIDVCLDCEDIKLNSNIATTIKEESTTESVNIFNIDIEELTESININKNKKNKLSSSNDDSEEDDSEEDDSEDDNSEDDDSEDDDSEDDDSEEDDSEEDDSDDDSSDISCIEAIIPNTPVLMILMEKCNDTLDNLMLYSDISIEEWCGYLMQIIMILITYQEKFQFTHNDLHTSNIMYVETDIKYLFYKYENKIYKVPTFNKIFKIIDFGRCIYNYNEKLFWSDSFCKDEDAHTQYNFGPFLDDNKPTINNNPSFDLSRLACSLYDYFDEYKFTKNKNSVELFNLIKKWCSDKNNKNLLYNDKGKERYPEFKLYKIIAKNINHCIPKEQLNNPIFNQYLTSEDYTSESLIDIDSLKI